MSDTENWKQRLAPEWNNFLATIGGPWVVCLLVVFMVLGILAVWQPQLTLLLSGVLSILSAFIGALMWDRWSKITEQKLLVTRGKSAIRALTGLLSNIGSARKRIAEYLELAKGCEGDTNPPEILTWLQEEILRLNNLRQETITSIENWTDIIPQANIRQELDKLSAEVRKIEGIEEAETVIEKKIEDLQRQIEEERQDAKQEKAALSREATAAGEEKSKLEKQLKVVKVQLIKAKEELKERIDRNPLLSEITVTEPLFRTFNFKNLAESFVLQPSSRCSVCNKLVDPGLGAVDGIGRCSDCAANDLFPSSGSASSEAAEDKD